MRYVALLFLLVLAICPGAGAQDWAKERLNKSPRHLDWVKVKQGNRQLKCFIAYPETNKKATIVLLIHEIFGLSDWVRGVCDQLAEKGYIAVAPDLLSGNDGQDTSKYQGADAQRKAITSLPSEQVTADLKAVCKYASNLPAANGKLAVMGFCWGGTQTFRFATNNSGLKSAFVFYGTAPEDKSALQRIKCPVYGFYGENDARVAATIEKTVAAMTENGKVYEPKTYSGAGHGFMRSGEAPDATAENKKARAEAWQRLLGLLSKI